MKYTVEIRHYAAGRFWEKGDVREADPAEVAPQVQRGVLKAKGEAKTKTVAKAD